MSGQRQSLRKHIAWQKNMEHFEIAECAYAGVHVCAYACSTSTHKPPLVPLADVFWRYVVATFRWNSPLATRGK